MLFRRRLFQIHGLNGVFQSDCIPSVLEITFPWASNINLSLRYWPVFILRLVVRTLRVDYQGFDLVFLYCRWSKEVVVVNLEIQ